MTYNRGKIRQLLNEALTSDQLSNLCFDHPEFCDIYENFNASGNRAQCQRDLINIANQKGIIKKILDFVQLENPTKYLELAPYSDDEQAVGEKCSSDLVVRESSADSQLKENVNSSHLIVVVFWLKSHEKKVLVSSKLCYREVDKGDIKQLSLQTDNDDSTRELSNFPTTLSSIITLATNNLSTRLSNPLPPKIELYVPVELMSKPLSFWCGEEVGIWRRHSIMIGCSDRYNPRNSEAAKLRAFANSGWHRFQTSVPDNSSQSLKHLKWLTSKLAGSKSLNDYAGMKCNGEWLSSDEEALSNWVELVRSGIPLALWNCDGKLQPREISSVFKSLTCGTRLELVTRIPIVRDEQHKKSIVPVGVLLEDPDYTPDIPSLSEDQLTWPGA